jgi:short-subunit dehydrogenase
VPATEVLGLLVDLLIHNAGFGTYGAYDTIDPMRDHEQAMVLVMAVVDRTHAYLPDMARRRDGASGASFQPMPCRAARRDPGFSVVVQ